MTIFYLGIDVAKDKFDVCLLHDDQKWSGIFTNDKSGFYKLDKWLTKRVNSKLWACMEATGRYGENLARHLHQVGCRVSVVNPARIKRYAQSQLRRNKTDRLDAIIIADFCRTQKTHEWQPPTEAEMILKQLVNRLHIQASIEAHLVFLHEQIELVTAEIQNHIDQHPDLKTKQALLKSVPGIGKKTSAVLLAELPNSKKLSSKQIAAFAGLTPEQLSSGKYHRSQDKLSKMGRVSLRTALYMPALSAMRYNPIALALALAERLREKGKQPMTIIAAVMRKLLVLAYGVLKSGQKFDPDFAVNA